MQWIIKSARVGQTEELLKRGYEPFGVSPHVIRTPGVFGPERKTVDHIYFKKRDERRSTYEPRY